MCKNQNNILKFIFAKFKRQTFTEFTKNVETFLKSKKLKKTNQLLPNNNKNIQNF